MRNIFYPPLPYQVYPVKAVNISIFRRILLIILQSRIDSISASFSWIIPYIAPNYYAQSNFYDVVLALFGGHFEGFF